MRGVPILQTTTTTLPIKILITARLLVYVNGVPIQQPKRVNSYPQSSGKLPGSLFNGRSLRGKSPNQDPHGRLALNPHVRFYGWQA
jgi:hypothetical protein